MQPSETQPGPMQIGINMAARMTGKNKSVIWRDTKAGKLSATVDGKGKTVYNLAELERVYGRLAIPEGAGGVAVVRTTRSQIDFEREKLALKLEFLERELGLVRDQMSQVREDRDHWRVQAETALRALPVPGSATAETRIRQRSGFWPFRRTHTA